ncbi:Histone deacetylase complex subunit SAP130-B [Nymphon striatum]|nr:Histone deacetylase complex subunit SAP130-B [Nymphon striatum]
MVRTRRKHYKSEELKSVPIIPHKNEENKISKISNKNKTSESDAVKKNAVSPGNRRKSRNKNLNPDVHEEMQKKKRDGSSNSRSKSNVEEKNNYSPRSARKSRNKNIQKEEKVNASNLRLSLTPAKSPQDDQSENNSDASIEMDFQETKDDELSFSSTELSRDDQCESSPNISKSDASIEINLQARAKSPQDHHSEDNTNMPQSDDDSDSPIEMDVKATKKAVLHEIKGMKDAIRRDADKKKKKRQELNEKFVEQKKKKAMLDALRLPESLLHNLDQPKEQDEVKAIYKKLDIPKGIDLNNRKRNYEKTINKGSTEFKIYNMDDVMKKPYDSTEAALSFRDRMLKRKAIPREPVSANMSSSDGNVPDTGKKFPPTSSSRPLNASEIAQSSFSSSVPLDLASKPELVPFSSNPVIPQVSAPPVNAGSNVSLRLNSQPKQETRPSMSVLYHQKIIRGPAAAITGQPAMRPSSSDPRSTTPRAPLKVDQLVKMGDGRLNTTAGQAVGVRVPVSISMSAAPPMASIMRPGNASVIHPSSAMHQLMPQHNAMSTNSSVQYTHVPIGPAAIANITVQKSATVATPVRPQFTMTHLNANNKSSSNISGPNQQQFPISPAIHIKDSGVQIPSAGIAVARQQISLSMPSGMLVTPTKTLPATANLAADNLRFSEDKGFMKQPIGAGGPAGVTIAMTCAGGPACIPAGVTIAMTGAHDTEQHTKTVVVGSGSGHVASGLTSSLTPLHNIATPSISVTTSPYLPHSSNMPVHQAQAVLTSPPTSQNRSVVPHQNTSATHIVHTVAPISLQCQPANKSGIAVGKNVVPTQTSTVPISASTASRSKSVVTATAPSNVPIAKVYPQQQAIASTPSSVSVKGRLQAADLSNRNVSLQQQQHNYGGSTVKLPLGMVTNVSAPSSSVPRTTAATLNLSTSSTPSNVTVSAAPPAHPSAATDRSTISVDISTSLPYASQPTAYYYGHQRIERSVQHQQHSPQPKPTTPIRPSGAHASQPVRLGQMVVTVNPNRPHQLSLHQTSPNVEGVTVSLPESGINAPGSQQLPTIYTISTTVASSSANIAPPYAPLVTTTATPAVTTTSHLPPSSPRPSILRKRPSELSNSGIRKNLMTATSLGVDSDSPSKQLALMKSPMKTRNLSKSRAANCPDYRETIVNFAPNSAVGHDRNVCNKIVKQEFSDNSESGIDVKLGGMATYSITSSTNGSNGAASSNSSSSSSTVANNYLATSSAPPYEASPRKKPRKQQLLANELKEVQSSDGEEHKVVKNESNSKMDSKLPSLPKTKSSSVTNKEDENNKWEDLRKQYSLINTYRHSWKTCNNHFLRPSDIKSKDEKKMTVNDLANQKYISQKVDGWKLHHFSVQMDDLISLESDIHEKLTNLLVRFEEIHMKCDSNEEETNVHRTNELVKANLQRSRLISQQMNDSKVQVFKIFDHKPRVLDIINKYVSKRSVKKRERF